MMERAQRLEHLARGIQHCHRCPLHRERRHAVPGEGPADAAVMFVGEAPGEEEDKAGRPFVGRSGRFLDQVLEECGIVRDRLFITSSVKCRPPGNRDPKDLELTTCKHHWLDAQIDILDPGLVVILGRVAMKQLLETAATISSARQGINRVLGRNVLVTYHPTAAMRFPEPRRAFISDMATVGEYLKMLGQKAGEDGEK